MGGAASGVVPKAACGRRLVAQLLSVMDEVRIGEVVELGDALPSGCAEDAAQRLATLDDVDPRARAGVRGTWQTIGLRVHWSMAAYCTSSARPAKQWCLVPAYIARDRLTNFRAKQVFDPKALRRMA